MGDLSEKVQRKSKRTGGMARGVEPLPSNLKALRSVSIITKENKAKDLILV
jgi:hypothetical protein